MVVGEVHHPIPSLEEKHLILKPSSIAHMRRKEMQSGVFSSLNMDGTNVKQVMKEVGEEGDPNYEVELIHPKNPITDSIDAKEVD